MHWAVICQRLQIFQSEKIGISITLKVQTQFWNSKSRNVCMLNKNLLDTVSMAINNKAWENKENKIK